MHVWRRACRGQGGKEARRVGRGGRKEKRAALRANPVLSRHSASARPLRSPEPHILLFRRVIGTDPTTGKVDPVVAAKALEAYKKEYGLA